MGSCGLRARGEELSSCTVGESAMFFKILGPILTGVGSLVLAWRVKTILDALVLAQNAAEVNFRSISAFLQNKARDLPVVVGLDEHVARSQQQGFPLLIIGFLPIAAGGFMSGLAIWFGS